MKNSAFKKSVSNTFGWIPLRLGIQPFLFCFMLIDLAGRLGSPLGVSEAQSRE